MNIIKEFKSLDRKDKAKYSTCLSLIGNLSLAIGKYILAIFKGIFFFIAGSINIFFFFAKLECFKGLRNKDNTYSLKNKVVSIFVILAGLMYSIYMGTLIFISRDVMHYNEFLAIFVACIAFVEMFFALRGLTFHKKYGHYYRNLKIINFASTLTSLIWCMLALLIYLEKDYQFICGICGFCVGIVIIILGVYLIFAPRISIVDREYNEYTYNDNILKSPIILSRSKVVGNYYYEYIIEDGIIKGHIKKDKWIWVRLNVFWKIMVCILSEILVFYYFIVVGIYAIKTVNLPKKLDVLMNSYGCKKIEKSLT